LEVSPYLAALAIRYFAIFSIEVDNVASGAFPVLYLSSAIVLA